MTRRPLMLTTSTHAFALVIYPIHIALAVLYLTGVAKALAMTEWIGIEWVSIWAATMFLSGILGVIGSLLAPRQKLPETALRMEMWGAIGVGLCSILYQFSLVHGNGWFGVPTTQTYAIAFGLGSLGRALQIGIEEHRLQAAIRDPQPANPAPLAKADHPRE